MSENGLHKPRLCRVVKGENGYGFHLHGEKGKVGQRIRKVEEGSAAEQAGLRMGDKIICVNGANVERDSHQEVVKKIKEKENETELFVVDEDTEKYFKEKGIPLTIELLSNGVENSDSSAVSEPKASQPDLEPEPEVMVESNNTSEDKSGETRPRLCQLEKGEGGYGFNLHSEKGKPGRYIRSVDADSPADRAGMKAGDRIIEINGENMEFDKHAKVVGAIKESGDSVKILVVDEDTDLFFKKCNVTPSSKHISGPLPTPQTKLEDDDILNMDLTMLKEKSRSSRKKKAPDSDWQKRQAMFNNM